MRLPSPELILGFITQITCVVKARHPVMAYTEHHDVMESQ